MNVKTSRYTLKDVTFPKQSPCCTYNKGLLNIFFIAKQFFLPLNIKLNYVHVMMYLKNFELKMYAHIVVNLCIKSIVCSHILKVSILMFVWNIEEHIKYK